MIDILDIEFGSCGDNLTAYYRDGHFYLSIEEPWAGCTETGFGARTSATLDKQNAETLRDLLNEFLEGK